MIDNSLVKIIINDKEQLKFYKKLKKINKISSKYSTYMGIDYEFNTKKVALMQILFEVHKKDKKIKLYYIIYPPNLKQKIYDYLKYNIMSNIKILKILHGSESLDMPYLVNEYYEFEIEACVNFFLSMIDTRYLCEYINNAKSQPNICRIYDLLLNFNVIDKKELELLDKNENEMGPIYKIIIDINKLTPALISYSIHDVVYLTDAFIALRDVIIKMNPKDYYILVDCIRYCFMEKRFVSNIGDDISLINSMNNYFFHINKTNNNTKYMIESLNLIKTEQEEFYYRIFMIRAYDIIIADFFKIFESLKYITSINYLKINILNLLKTVVYVVILQNYKVKMTKTEIINYDLNKNYDIILEGLKILDLNHLLELIEKFYEFCQIKLKP